MLVIKINSDKDKAIFQNVLRALSEFDVHSASWEDEPGTTQIKVDPPKGSGAADVASLLDFALNLGKSKTR